MDYTKDIEVLEEFKKQHERILSAYRHGKTQWQIEAVASAREALKTITHAIQALKALQSAKEDLPEKKKFDIGFQGDKVAGYNQAIDIFTPIYAKLKLENEKLRKKVASLEIVAEVKDKLWEELQALKDKITVERIAKAWTAYYGFVWDKMEATAQKAYLKVAQTIVKDLKGEK